MQHVAAAAGDRGSSALKPDCQSLTSQARVFHDTTHEDRAVRSGRERFPCPKSARGGNDRPLSPSRHSCSLPAPVARKLARCRSRSLQPACRRALARPSHVSAPSELERNHPADAKEHPCACNGFPKPKVLVEQLHRRWAHLSDTQIPTGTPLPAGKHRELSESHHLWEFSKHFKGRQDYALPGGVPPSFRELLYGGEGHRGSAQTPGLRQKPLDRAASLPTTAAGERRSSHHHPRGFPAELHGRTVLHFQLPVCLQTTLSQVKRGNGGVPKSGCVTPSSWDSALEAPEAEGQTSPGRELPRKQQRRRLLETQKRPGSCPTSARSCGTRRISGKPSPAGRLAQPPSSSRAPTRVFPAGERYPALREALGALRRASRRQLGKAGAPGPRLFLPQRFTGVSTTTRVSNGQTWGKRVAGG